MKFMMENEVELPKPDMMEETIPISPEIEFTSEPHAAAFKNILDVEAALSADAKD